MELQMIGEKNQKIDIAESIFGCEFNEPLVHQVVTAYLAGGRAGTKAQKNRSAVRGGGVKPWRQKGTGRARAGTIRSPLWRKGGVTFAAQPRSYDQKINKKMYRSALRSILSELVRSGRLQVVETFAIETHKTKDFLKKLASLNLPARVEAENTGVKKRDHRLLIITDTIEENLYLATRNLFMINVRDVVAIDPVSLVGSEQVMITAAALRQLEESFK